MSFDITHNGETVSVRELDIRIEFDGAGNFARLRTVSAFSFLSQEGKRGTVTTKSRAVEILQAAGITPSDIGQALRLLIRESILDEYDDSRQS